MFTIATPFKKQIIKIQGHVLLRMLHICQKYTFIITVMVRSLLKNSSISSKIIKTEGLGEKKIAYMKHIKIQSCNMGVIFTPKHMTWQRKKCVHNHSQIMRYHTGNVYWVVVPNVQALIFLTRKQMIIIPTPVLQLVFTIII